VDPLLLAAGVGVAVGAALQSATGFGFAVLAAPLMFAALDPREAIGLLLLLGMVHGTLTLATEGRRPRPAVATCATILGWSAPGAVVGVVALRALDATALQVAVSLGVLATLAVRRLQPVERAPATRWGAPVAGFSAGALVTSTNTSGPPLLLYLLGRGDEAGRVRDTLTVCQLGLSVIGAIALVVTGTSGAVPRGWLVAVFVPIVIVAHIAGRPLFRRLEASGGYEPVLTGILVAAVATGLATALI
jgi:uncharacterized membrane protein YfcA